MWKEFWFNGNLWWGHVHSREQWLEILVAYNETMSLEKLKQAKVCPSSLTDDPYPNFGFYPENDGDLTLGEWAKENGVDLDLDLTSNIDVAVIDEMPRYDYSPGEIRTIKRRVIFGRQDEKYCEGVGRLDLAILGRTLPAYFLDQLKKLHSKRNLSDQARIAYLRIILRKVLRSRIISDEITMNQVRQFIDTGSPLSVMNIVTRRLENIVAKEGTKVEES
jgi:hypothetical protein